MQTQKILRLIFGSEETSESDGRSRGPRLWAKPRLAVLRSRQATCPQETSNWEDVSQPPPNPIVITWDYGAGCVDKDGDFFKGSVSMSIYDPEIDPEVGVVGWSRLVFSFNNFSDGRKTISGSTDIVRLTNGDPAGPHAKYKLNLRYTNTTGCSLRLVEEGTITFVDETKFTETGSGEVSGSLNASYQKSDLLWNPESDCDYPEGGVLQITSGGRTETWTFSSVCGRATVAVDGGKPQVVTLPPLKEDDPADPCD